MLYYLIIHLLVHSTQQLFAGCRWGQCWEHKHGKAIALPPQEEGSSAADTDQQSPGCHMNAAGRHIQTALGAPGFALWNRRRLPSGGSIEPG